MSKNVLQDRKRKTFDTLGGSNNKSRVLSERLLPVTTPGPNITILKFMMLLNEKSKAPTTPQETKKNWGL
jgi:hypothetical protein